MPEKIGYCTTTYQWFYGDVKPQEWGFAIDQLKNCPSGTVLSPTYASTQLQQYRDLAGRSFTLRWNYLVVVDHPSRQTIFLPLDDENHIVTINDSAQRQSLKQERKYLGSIACSDNTHTMIRKYQSCRTDSCLNHTFITFNRTIYALDSDVRNVASGSYARVLCGITQDRQTFLAFKMLHPWKTPRTLEYTIGVKVGFFEAMTQDSRTTDDTCCSSAISVLSANSGTLTAPELPACGVVDTTAVTDGTPVKLPTTACDLQTGTSGRIPWLSLPTVYVSKCYPMDLYTFCKKLKTLYTDKQKCSLMLFDICLRLCNQLAQLHQQNILHLDIKPENILINFKLETPQDWSTLTVTEVAIADFGFSIELPSDGSSVDGRPYGTQSYMAPEIASAYLLKKQSICLTRACDVYSLGVTFQVLHLLSQVQLQDDFCKLCQHMTTQNPLFRLHLCYVKFLLIEMVKMLGSSQDCVITTVEGIAFLHFLFDQHNIESCALADDFWFRFAQVNQNNPTNLNRLQHFFEKKITQRVLRICALQQCYGKDSASFAKVLAQEQCDITTAAGADFLLWLIEQNIFSELINDSELIRFVVFLQNKQQQYQFLIDKLSVLCNPNNQDPLQALKISNLCNIVRTGSWRVGQQSIDLYTPFVASGALFDSDNQDGLLDLLSRYFLVLLDIACRVNPNVFFKSKTRKQPTQLQQSLDDCRQQITALMSTPATKTAPMAANA